MFSDMTTYSMTLLKGKRWAKLLGIRKNGAIARYDGRDYGQLKDLISDRSRWRQDSNRESMSETCWKQQKIQEKREEREKYLDIYSRCCLIFISMKDCVWLQHFRLCVVLKWWNLLFYCWCCILSLEILLCLHQVLYISWVIGYVDWNWIVGKFAVSWQCMWQ